MRKIAILYSGGFDSTYMTTKISGNYDEVHLVTQIVPLALFTKFASKNAAKLKQIYGNKVIHKYLNSKGLIRNIRGNFLRVVADNAKFGFYYSWCLGCKIGMHTAMVKYCIQNRINYVADGNNYSQSAHALEQGEGFIYEMKKFYAKYGITYFCPIYNEYKIKQCCGFMHSILQQAEMVNNKGKEKDELVKAGFKLGPYIGQQYRTIQPQCLFALFLNINRLLFSLLVKEKKGCAVNYLSDKIAAAERIIGLQE